jgi:hypothetical protein
MAHPYASKAKTGQQLADARYDKYNTPNKMPVDPVLAAARKNTRESDGPEEVFTAAPARQISNMGNVRK